MDLDAVTRLYTSAEVRDDLLAAIGPDHGGKTAFARQHGFTPQLISMIVLGKEVLGRRVAASLGYERVILYRRVKEKACNARNGDL